MTPGFWKGQTVLVTGHTGFMGGWLSLWLAEEGARVTGFALAPPTTPSFFEAARLKSRLRSIEGDVRDMAALERAFRTAAPEIVFHLAAQPLVREAHRAPRTTFETNVMGTVNVLEAARVSRTVRAIVVVTSDKVYENREWPWGYREDDRLGGREPYGASKACAEMVAEAYRRAYFETRAERCGLATVRAGNVFGGGDWAADRLVPDAVRAFARGATLSIRHPEATRPWQHVLDPIGGYLLLAERLAGQPESFSGAWNFGPDEDGTKSVAWVADRLAHHWGDGARWVPANDGGPYEARFLSVTSAKAATGLGWRPVWDVDRGLGGTVFWYRRYLATDTAEGLSLEQLHHFREAA